MENGINVLYVKEYICGYCVNNEKIMYQKTASKKVQFPARVLLIKHRNYGYILIDTGYSEKIYENGMISKLYNHVNLTFFKPKDCIATQLKQDNIQPQEISHIIITHLHPDHIGGLYAFPNAKLHASILAKKTFFSSNPFKVMFKNMITKEQIIKISPIEKCVVKNNHIISKVFDKMYDLFGDESIYIIPLSGHTEEQIGVLIDEHNLFFIADATWTTQCMQKDLKFMPRRIQNNYEKYQITQKKLATIKHKMPEINLIASHDPVFRRGVKQGLGARIWEKN